jgi:hypothetical protein
MQLIHAPEHALSQITVKLVYSSVLGTLASGSWLDHALVGDGGGPSGTGDLLSLQPAGWKERLPPSP